MISVCPKRNFPLSCSIWWSTGKDGGKSTTTSQAEGRCQVHWVFKLTIDVDIGKRKKLHSSHYMHSQHRYAHYPCLLFVSGQLGRSSLKIPRPDIEEDEESPKKEAKIIDLEPSGCAGDVSCQEPVTATC